MDQNNLVTEYKKIKATELYHRPFPHLPISNLRTLQVTINANIVQMVKDWDSQCFSYILGWSLNIRLLFLTVETEVHLS